MASVADARIRQPFVPGCWTAAQIAAAKVTELSIRLDVGALRCRRVDPLIDAKYNDYVRVSADAAHENAKIVKGHFGDDLALYDHYSIMIANKYGAGRADDTCEKMAALMQAAIAEGATVSGLAAVAEQAGIDPVLPGGACPVAPTAPLSLPPNPLSLPPKN